MKQAVPVTLLGVGALLLVTSLVAPRLAASAAPLSEEDYARLETLEAKVVDLYQQIERIKARTGDQRAAEEASLGYQKAVDERDALRAKLQEGVQRPGAWATILRYAGVGALALGVVAYLALKPK